VREQAFPFPGLVVMFGVVDVGFFLANIVKVLEGGWVSILVAGVKGWRASVPDIPDAAPAST
jgi:K+ transporter